MIKSNGITKVDVILFLIKSKQEVIVRHVFWSARPLRRLKNRNRNTQWSTRPNRRMGKIHRTGSVLIKTGGIK